jgi:integrase
VSIRKHGDGWQVRVAPFPAKTVPRKRDAERLEIDLKTKKALGHLHVAEPITFGNALDDLFKRKTTVGGKRGKLRPKSVKWLKESIAPWEPLRDTLVPSLRRKKIEDHVVKIASTRPVTARNALQVGKAALRLAESRGQMVDKAIFAIEPVSHEAAEGVALTPDELLGLAAHHPERLKRLILLTGTIGFRFAEAVALTEEWIDLRAGTVTVPRDLNKSRRAKRIPLAPSEVVLIREQLALSSARPLLFPTLGGAVYSSSGFRKLWVPARDAAGLGGPPAFKFHWLRHTAISLMAQAGMKPEVIAERVGHSDGGALIYRRYRHLFDSERGAAMSLIDGLLDAAASEEGT